MEGMKPSLVLSSVVVEATLSPSSPRPFSCTVFRPLMGIVGTKHEKSRCCSCSRSCACVSCPVAEYAGLRSRALNVSVDDENLSTTTLDPIVFRIAPWTWTSTWSNEVESLVCFFKTIRPCSLCSARVALDLSWRLENGEDSVNTPRT